MSLVATIDNRLNKNDVAYYVTYNSEILRHFRGSLNEYFVII